MHSRPLLFRASSLLDAAPQPAREAEYKEEAMHILIQTNLPNYFLTCVQKIMMQALKGKFVQTGDTVNGDKNSFCRVWSASHGSGRKWDKAFVISQVSVQLAVYENFLQCFLVQLMFQDVKVP